MNNASVVSKIIKTLAQLNGTGINFSHTNGLFRLDSNNKSNLVSPTSATYAQLLFTTKSGLGWILALAMPTGWALWLILGIVEVFSMPCIRKKGYFQVFYYTHWLHVVYYALLIVHAKNFWKWFVGPAILIVFERLYTFIRYKSVKYGDTYIKDVNLLSSKVHYILLKKKKLFLFF